MVLGQRRATVETTLRETQEENDEFRRRILGLEQQLKEAQGLAEGGWGSGGGTTSGQSAPAGGKHSAGCCAGWTPWHFYRQALVETPFFSTQPLVLVCQHALRSPSQCAAFVSCSFALTIPVKLGFVSWSDLV